MIGGLRLTYFSHSHITASVFPIYDPLWYSMSHGCQRCHGSQSRPRLEGHEAPELAAVRHPLALVGVVADAEIDLDSPVHVDDPRHHVHGQDRARRQAVVAPVVG